MPQGKFPYINFKTFWQGSTLQLLGVIILPLALLVLAFALGSTWLHQRAMREMVGERDELAVQAAAGALSAEIHHSIDDMRGLALEAGTASRTFWTWAWRCFLPKGNCLLKFPRTV